MSDAQALPVVTYACLRSLRDGQRVETHASLRRRARVAPVSFGAQVVAGFAVAHSAPQSMSGSPIASPTQDAEIVARLVAGEERALGELYDRYGGLAYSLACAMLVDPADAEEVVADAFAQIWRSASTYDASRGNPLAWITTIVRSRALDLLRAHRRRSRALANAVAKSDDSASPGLSTGPESADRGVEQSETAALVRRSLADLPVAQRTVLELAYFGGLSQSEIAQRLSEPLGTVKTRMRSGMEKLRNALRPLLEARS
jgi:RNA polymerase sigma-70 factor, ECF subfamily